MQRRRTQQLQIGGQGAHPHRADVVRRQPRGLPIQKLDMAIGAESGQDCVGGQRRNTLGRERRRRAAAADRHRRKLRPKERRRRQAFGYPGFLAKLIDGLPERYLAGLQINRSVLQPGCVVGVADGIAGFLGQVRDGFGKGSVPVGQADPRGRQNLLVQKPGLDSLDQLPRQTLGFQIAGLSGLAQRRQGRLSDRLQLARGPEPVLKSLASQIPDQRGKPIRIGIFSASP